MFTNIVQVVIYTIILVCCYKSGLLNRLFIRPSDNSWYRDSNGIRFATKYPLTSAFIFLIPILIPLKFTNYHQCNYNISAPKQIITPYMFVLLSFRTIFDELVFRGLWFKYWGINKNTISSSACVYALIYYIYNPIFPTLLIFYTLGITYGLSRRKYSLGELCIYRTLLHCLLLSY